MKALSVQQPWAALLLDGIKTIEVRSWATKHRGPLLICASAMPKNVFFKFNDGGTELLPAGAIIGIVDLIDCRPMVEADANEGGAACDFSPGAFAWVVKRVTWCKPDPLKGALSLFNVPDEKIIKLNDDSTEDVDSFWYYPKPQGEIKFDARKHHHIEFD